MDRIQISKPFMGEEEINAVKNVLLSGNLVQGEKVREFENGIANYVGVKHGIATSSGTTALQLAVDALGIKAGDEVITTPFTFISSSNCILYNGAKPVFVDIDRKTFNIDPDLIEEAITERTKAILIVHLYGNVCDMKKIMRICKENNLMLIEDCAQSIGAEFDGKRSGSFGEISALSFYATKNLTTGEGGMLLSDKEDFANSSRLKRSHGQQRIYEHEIVGYNYRMTDIVAAIGIEQLKKIEMFNKTRIENAKLMTQLLSDVDGIILPYVQPEVKHVFHQYTIRVLNGKRNGLMKHLNSNNVQSMVYYPTVVYLQQAYSDMGYESGICPESERACKEVLSLPIHPYLKKSDLERIANEVKRYMK